MSWQAAVDYYYRSRQIPRDIAEIVSDVINNGTKTLHSEEESSVKGLLKVGGRVILQHPDLLSVDSVAGFHDTITDIAEGMGPRKITGHMYRDASKIAKWLTHSTNEDGWWLETGRDIHQAIIITASEDPIYAMCTAEEFAEWSLARALREGGENVLTYSSLCSSLSYLNNLGKNVCNTQPVIKRIEPLVSRIEDEINRAIYLNRR